MKATRRPRGATVVVGVPPSEQTARTMVRDLAVAAYALRSRGMVLEVLLTDPGGDAAAEVARKTAADVGLALETLPVPSPDAGQAYLAAFRAIAEGGRGDLVVTLDASGRHDATQIPHLVDQLAAEDLDVVIGSRWARGSGTPGLSPGRWVLGRLANMAFRLLTGTRGIADATTSFRVARVEVVRDFTFAGTPVTHHTVQTAFVAMAVANGYSVGEGAIIYRLAEEAGGGLRARDIGAFAGHLARLRGQVDRARQRRLSPSGRAFSEGHFGAAADLERLGTAQNFFGWVLDELDPYLRGRLLEVGAGLGTITRLLAERYPDTHIVALEPADNLYADLESFAALEPRVSARCQTLLDYDGDSGFDTAIYLNVLEHIDDDAREVRLAASALRPGGALVVFGPGLERLYSELDYKAGHYRRYDVRSLRELVTAAGLDVVSARYFDVLGVVPYFAVYRLLRRTHIAGSTMWGYDRVVVPLSRLIQRVVPQPPVGKNVLLVAVKPRSASHEPRDVRAYRRRRRGDRPRFGDDETSM